MIRVVDLSEGKSRFQNISRASAPHYIWLTSDLQDFTSFWPRSDRIGVARCYAFQCADILELECETLLIARSAKPLFIAVVNRSEEPLLLIPLSMEEHSNGTDVVKGVRVLKFLDGGLNDYNAPVVYPGVNDWDAGTVRTLWKVIQSLLPRFDIAIFERMPEQVHDLPNPWSALKTSRRHESGHAMTLSGRGWQEIESNFPHRRNVRYQLNRLNKRGKLSFELATPAQYDIFLQAMLQQKRKRYIETRGYDGLDRPGYNTYLSRAKYLLHPSGPVCLHALKVDETIIAAQFGYLVGRRFNGLIIGFDSGEWYTYSPSFVLLYKLLEWCVNNDLKIMDFGIGDESYKTQYCDILIELNEAVFYSTMKGLVSAQSRKRAKDWIWNNVPIAKQIHKRMKSSLIKASSNG